LHSSIKILYNKHMEIQGKIISALPERSGTSQRTGNTWKVQEFVVETHDQYPKKMAFEVFGEDRLQRFNIQVGQEVNIAFDIDAHEYNGRWFNSIRAYDVRLVDEQSQAASQPNAGEGMPMPEAPAVSSADLAGDSAEDLPF
jgi:hypothetical protein